jgi:hypothetical protein
MPLQKWRGHFGINLYQSGDITASGDTGILPTVGLPLNFNARFPIVFIAAADGLGVGQSLEVAIDWYMNPEGTDGVISTTTFDKLTPNSSKDIETWPGDAFPLRDMVPIFPFHKITYTLAGPGGPVSFRINYAYLTLDA